VAGFLLGQGATGVLDLKAQSGLVEDLAAVALIVILFRDGLEVDGELLQSQWHLPLRKLVIAMPITAAIVALLARGLLGLSWTESFLLGALLSPTDPVLSSGVVTNPRVPVVIRQSLNLESGLNDGLALPAVLAFAAALAPHSGGFVWWRFVLQDIGLGLAFGLVCGALGSVLMPRAGEHDGDGAIPAHQRALYGLVVIYVSGLAAEMVSEGTGIFRTALIITSQPEEVSNQVLTVMERGVTILAGTGAFTGAARPVLYCVITRSEVNQLKALVHEADPKAFMVIGVAHEALGEGFKALKQ